MVTTSPFSVRLAPKLKERSQAEAKRVDRPLGHVMQKAVEAYLAAADEKRAAIREAVERADAGYLIPGEAVNAWIESWGADDEAPMPTVERPKGRSRA
jgi:predicted transcriptional regulator